MDELKNLRPFRKDLEALCHKHRVAMVFEYDEKLGCGFTLEPWGESEDTDILVYVDWCMHRKDSDRSKQRNNMRVIK